MRRMAAGASAPMLRFESPASAGLSNLYLAEAKSADAVLPVPAADALHCVSTGAACGSFDGE